MRSAGVRRYFWVYRDGHSSQPVISSATTLDGEPSVVLDPNAISTDGSLAFRHMTVSDDGKRLAYGIAQGGGDWLTWHVRDLVTGKDLPDQLPFIEYYDPVFTHDGNSRFPAPAAGKELTETDHDHRLYFHELGRPVADDPVVYGRPEHATEQFQPEITRDGHYLLITIAGSSAGASACW